jgi:hypothetical protein
MKNFYIFVLLILPTVLCQSQHQEFCATIHSITPRDLETVYLDLVHIPCPESLATPIDQDTNSPVKTQCDVIGRKKNHVVIDRAELHYYPVGSSISVNLNVKYVNTKKKRQFVSVPAVLFYGAAISPLIALFAAQPPRKPSFLPDFETVQEQMDRKAKEKKFLDLISKPVQHAPTKQQQQQQQQKQQQQQQQQCSTVSYQNRGDGIFKQTPAGSGPPPPNQPPWKKPLPASRINLKPSKKQQKRQKFPPLLNPQLSVSQIDEDNAIVISDDETFIPIQASSTMTLTTTCIAPHRTSRQSSTSSVMSMASSSGASHGPDEEQVFFMLPTIRAHAGTDPGVEVEIHYPVSEQWRGLSWATPDTGYSNSCNIDSFLSHVIYLSRSLNGYFRRHLNLINNPMEDAIRQVILPRSDTETATSFSRHIHEIWANAIGTTIPTYGVVDLLGSEGLNVFRHLLSSSNVWFVHNCGCQRASLSSDRDAIKRWSPELLENLCKTSPTAANAVTHKSSKKCHRCLDNFRYERGMVSQASWFHAFNIKNQPDHYSMYPPTLEFQNIGSTEIIYFDIGYFTYSTNIVPHIQHQVSIHRIGLTWRFYDGMHPQGQLQNVPLNLDTDFHIETVIYFRRP